MTTPWILAIAYAVATAGISAPDDVTLVDYDATIRFHGELSCPACPPEAIAEVSVLAGRSGVLTDKYLGKIFVKLNTEANVVQNYYWGRRIVKGSEDAKEFVKIFVFIADCDSYDVSRSIDTLPMVDNVFLFDIDRDSIKCDQGRKIRK